MVGFEPTSDCLKGRGSTIELHSELVGDDGFEPPIFRSQSERHTPWLIPDNMERVVELESTSSAWKAEAQPLYHTRVN